MSYNKKKEDKDCKIENDRRNFLKIIPAFGLLLANPVNAFNLLDDVIDVIDPEGKSKKLQKAKKIGKGASNIVASSKEMDYNSEFSIGQSLALEGFKRYGMPLKNPGIQKYVNLVGDSIARNSDRSGTPGSKIKYHFSVIESPLYNAFACPGGIIFLSSSLFKSMNSEAELACVLGHEITHVDHKHALKTIKRAKFFEGIGQISAATMRGKDGKKFNEVIGSLQNLLFEKGLDQGMEYEADISGMELAYKTGYNPEGLINVLKMLKAKESRATKKGSWFSTHPPLNERIKKCKAKMTSYPDARSLAKVSRRFAFFKKRL